MNFVTMGQSQDGIDSGIDVYHLNCRKIYSVLPKCFTRLFIYGEKNCTSSYLV